jgi:hypothetical protein
MIVEQRDKPSNFFERQVLAFCFGKDGGLPLRYRAAAAMCIPRAAACITTGGSDMEWRRRQDEPKRENEGVTKGAKK